MTYVKTYLPTLKTHIVNLKRDGKDLSRDLQRLEVRGKLESKTLCQVGTANVTAAMLVDKKKSVPQRKNPGCLSFTRANWSVHGLGQW